MLLPDTRKLMLIGVGIAIAVTALPVAAAENGLEEVVVTARKREENLQTVPLSITALTDTEIQRRSIRDLQDVATNTPGLTYFDANPVLEIPVIRGLSQTVISAPDRNVGMFYNGVFLSNTNASNFNMLDMERVEVVKGPVSSLYGRNGFAGAINYVPKQANLTGGWSGYVEATGGSQSRGGGKGAVNIPITDTLAARLTAGYDQWDGSIPNAFGGYAGGYKSTQFGWDVRWKPNDKLSVGEFGFYVDDTRGETAQLAYPNNCGQVAGSGTSAANPPRPSFYCGAMISSGTIAIPPLVYGAKRNGVLTGLNVDYDFGPLTASVIGGFVDLKESYLEDLDLTTDPRGRLFYMYATPLGPLLGGQPLTTAYLHTYVGTGPDTTRDMSWELRFASRQDQAFRWMIGASYYEHYLTRSAAVAIDSTGYAGPGLPYSIYELAFSAFKPVTGLSSLIPFYKNHINDESPAGYLSFNYDLTSKLTLNGELRHDEEHRKLTQGLAPGVQSMSEGYWTTRFSADYKIDADRMVYASVAKGVIAGFFNGTTDATTGLPIPAALQAYKPSTNWTYEIGGKASWLDKRLITNLTLFYVKYTDLQITSLPPPPLVGTLTANAAGATSEGFELSADGRITDKISAGLGYAYTDPRYSSGAVDLDNTRFCGVAAPPLCTTDVSGNLLTRASQQTVNVYGEYDDKLTANWKWYARFDARYQSKQDPRSTELQWTPGYTIANARIGFSKGDRIDVDLWVKNLTDKVYIETGIAQPLANPTPHEGFLPDFIPNSIMGERRSYGVTARYKF